MASFVWRGQAAMIERDMMMHPGMSMNMPVQASHLAVGIVLHLAFSMLVGAIFIMILFALRRAGLSVLRRMNGDHRAFLDATLPYVDVVYQVARHAAGCGQDPEDLVQETHLRAYAAFDSYRGGNPRAWLTAICPNAARSEARRLSRLTQVGICLAVPGAIQGWVSLNLAPVSPLGRGCLIEVGLLGVSSH